MKFRYLNWLLLVIVSLGATAAWADIAPVPRPPFWDSGLHQIGIEILAAAVGGGALLYALRR